LGSVTILRDTFALFAACALLLFLLVYLPFGLAVALLVQDQAAPWLETLGAVAPLPYRIFRVIERWMPRLLPVLAVAAAAHCGLRRLLRRDAGFGSSLQWDAILSPVLSTIPLTFIGAGAVAALGYRSPNDIAAAAMVAVTVGVLFGAAGLIVGLIVRSRLVRALAIAIVALLALAPLARVAADAWGGARLRAHQARLEPEIAAERKRMAEARSPVLRERALDEDAAPRYLALMKAVSGLAPASREYVELGKTVSLGPDAPAAPEALALLEEHREAVRRLREATTCSRCLWEVTYDDPGAPIPSLLPARTLANLLILEGHERARARDPRGAAERYLDAARFGCDFRSGPLIHNLIGIAIAQMGLRSVGRLVVSDRLPPSLLAQIGDELERLEGHLPTVAAGFRHARLGLAGLGRAVDEHREGIGLATPRLLPLFVPYRLLAAQAAEAADPVWRQLERAVDVTDPNEADRTTDAVASLPAPTWNPIHRTLSPNLMRARVSSDDLAAWHALARAAVLVEQAGGGRNPATALTVSLPADPHASPQPIRYAPTPTGGYRLWSVGMNRTDDGGTSRDNLDLVLESRAR
jgi:hypothetical protein